MPAPSTAPVSAFVTLLAVEFVFVFVGVTVGFFTTDVGVVLVVGVVVVLVVTVGFVVAVVFVVGAVVLEVSVGLVVAGLVVIGLVSVGLVVKGGLGAKEVLGTEEGFDVSVGLFVSGLVTVEVNGRFVAPVD